MLKFPMEFKVSTQSSPEVWSLWNSNVESLGQKLNTKLAIPPEFDGPGGGYSPEDLYAMALINCFIATFKVVAEKSKLAFTTIQGEGVLRVDRGEEGAPWMKSMHLKFILIGAPDLDRARRLLEKTGQMCMILNSVKTEKTFEFEMRSL